MAEQLKLEVTTHKSTDKYYITDRRDGQFSWTVENGVLIVVMNWCTKYYPLYNVINYSVYPQHIPCYMELNNSCISPTGRGADNLKKGFIMNIKDLVTKAKETENQSEATSGGAFEYTPPPAGKTFGRFQNIS